MSRFYYLYLMRFILGIIYSFSLKFHFFSVIIIWRFGWNISFNWFWAKFNLVCCYSIKSSFISRILKSTTSLRSINCDLVWNIAFLILCLIIKRFITFWKFVFIWCSLLRFNFISRIILFIRSFQSLGIIMPFLNFITTWLLFMSWYLISFIIMMVSSLSNKFCMFLWTVMLSTSTNLAYTFIIKLLELIKIIVLIIKSTLGSLHESRIFGQRWNIRKDKWNKFYFIIKYLANAIFINSLK